MVDKPQENQRSFEDKKLKMLLRIWSLVFFQVCMSGHTCLETKPVHQYSRHG